jgi:GMP reductase
MDTVGTIATAKALSNHHMFTAIHKHYHNGVLFTAFRDPKHQEFSFYTMGVSAEAMQQVERMTLNNLAPSMFCIDIANGYLEVILETIAQLRALIPDAIIMAGNVVTGERAVAIIEAGADIVKVGIGGGSACTTRKQTGVGYPQLSAVYECARAVEQIGGMVCADGGCTVPGDVAKAFVAGADFVMLGGMLAGSDESGGTIVLHKKVPKKSVSVVESSGGQVYHFQGTNYYDLKELPPTAWKSITLETPQMLFYGMSSDTAMDKYNGGVAKYRSSEGRTVMIPYKGKVNDVVLDILGGVRSSMSYIGVKDIANAAYATEFVGTHHQLNTVFLK